MNDILKTGHLTNWTIPVIILDVDHRVDCRITRIFESFIYAYDVGIYHHLLYATHIHNIYEYASYENNINKWQYSINSLSQWFMCGRVARAKVQSSKLIKRNMRLSLISMFIIGMYHMICQLVVGMNIIIIYSNCHASEISITFRKLHIQAYIFVIANFWFWTASSEQLLGAHSVWDYTKRYTEQHSLPIIHNNDELLFIYFFILFLFFRCLFWHDERKQYESQ